MKRFLCLSVFTALAFASTASAAADCAKIIATGHPQYPVIAFKDGDAIAGAAPMLVEAIAKKLNVPLESKAMGSWADAQAATRDGKADMIFGVYFNDERAQYLDYVQPAFMYDDVGGLRPQGQEVRVQGSGRLDRQEGRHQSKARATAMTSTLS